MNIKKDQVPEGWEIKKLGEVLVRTEMVDPTKNPDIEFTYLDVSSVNKETKEIEAANVLLGKDAPSRAKKLVRVNDVIFATVRPTHSRVAMIPDEYDGQVCSTGYFVLRGKENIFNKYLFYFLLSTEFNQQMEKLQKGASYPAVTDSEVKSIILRYPNSILEQQRIVFILDEAFAAIAKANANAEQNLRNAKELFESYLQGVFEKKGEGWEEKTLGDVCRFENGDRGKNYPNRNEYIESGIPWINTGHIQKDGTLSETEMYYISEKKFNTLRSGKIQRGDLVYCLRGATLGKTALVAPFTKGAVASSLVIIRPNNKLNSRYLYFYLTSPYGQGFIKEYQNGAAQPNIGAKCVAKFLISVPPIEKQLSIVQKLDALSEETKKLEAIYQQKIHDLEELKKSILHKAFKGELKAEKQ